MESKIQSGGDKKVAPDFFISVGCGHIGAQHYQKAYFLEDSMKQALVGDIEHSYTAYSCRFQKPVSFLDMEPTKVWLFVNTDVQPKEGREVNLYVDGKLVGIRNLKQSYYPQVYLSK